MQQQIPFGRNIRANKVLCIDQDNNNLGIIDLFQALKLAENSGLDLVQVAPPIKGGVPTCKIVDLGKYRYELSKKQKALAKKQRESASKIKEIKFRPSTDINDLKIKANQAQEFLDAGDKVKITITFKGRELSYKEIGYDTLNSFLSLISDIETISQPSMDGRFLCAIIKKSQSIAKAS